MKAPEKIYVRVKNGKPFSIWNSEWVGVNDIEYTQTNAFIEKIKAWLIKNQKGFILTDKDITDFISFMKGEHV